MDETFNPAHLIEEMKHDVREEDVRKAALVLAHLKRVDEDCQLAILEVLSTGRPAFSLPLFATVVVEDPTIEMSFPEIREWMAKLAAEEPSTLLETIGTSRGHLRAALIHTAVEVGLSEASEHLLVALNQERDPVVLSTIIEALGELGGDAVANPVAEYLYVTDDDLFASAARALAKIGSPEAVLLLKQRMGLHRHLDEIIVGILWEIQTPESLKALNGVLSAPRAEVRAAAKQALRMTGSKALPVLLENLNSSDNDVLVHTLEVLGDIGDESALRMIRHLLQRHPADPNVRFAAFEALGKLPVHGKALALVSGLEDPFESVRVAAAGAIDKNFDAALAAGIRNLITGGSDTAAPVVKAMVDARSDVMVVSMSKSIPETFNKYFLNELSRRADIELFQHYVNLLAESGQQDIAEELKVRSPEKRMSEVRIFAVDDSPMILKIYKSVLHQLGFEPVVFDAPLVAVEAALKDPPRAVLTDLNMPEISGVELIRRIRTSYTRSQLPIVMVTTQQSGEDFQEAAAVGVNLVIHKPFTAVEIGEALKSIGVSP